MAQFIPNVFKGIAASSHTTPRVGYRLHERSGTRMTYVEFDVPNGTQLPNTIPFGVFAEIRELANTNLSQCQLWIAPGFFDDPSNPVFTQRSDNLSKINEYICTATRTRQVVAPSTAVDTGTLIWESNVIQIDEAHSEKTTVTVVTRNDVVDAVWDEVLSTFITRTRTLVDSTTAEAHAQFPAGLKSAGGSNYHYITFTEIKCGWYIQSVEELTAQTYYIHNGSINDYWPAVVTALSIDDVLGEDEAGETYLYTIAKDVELKEAYNGPCKVQVAGAWSNTVPALTAPTQLLTDGFTYDGLTFDLTLPTSLHPSVQFTEGINNHPVLYTPQTRSKTYSATTHTDWPALKTIPQRPRPYKGGYLQETWVIHKPGS